MKLRRPRCRLGWFASFEGWVQLAIIASLIWWVVFVLGVVALGVLYAAGVL